MPQDMTELIAALKNVGIGTETEKDTRIKKGAIFTAKFITLAILIAAFGFGVYGSFEKASFNMTDYVSFLQSFTWFFAPLIVSIGAGSATKVISDGMKKKEKDTK
jgi:hypothetical protein